MERSMDSGNPNLGPAGLCSTCQNVRQIESSKGSVFLLCELSKTDPRFKKYPSLPVISCSGYELRGQNDPKPSSAHG